ncbi:DNA polymerase III delta subunit [hydrothermal vent metagenome]|uniref:DNA polymerase III subunit delta n=1 Tax=hydrothermal vent metagenome TaxID=652676 RepID=A0A3B1ALE2_9ZZZZ
MKIPFQQLNANLDKQLLPVYFVSGDEPFQVDEACRLIRAAAQQQGFSERQIFHVDQKFDWSSLAAEGMNLSLFSEKKLIEVRIPTAKPGREGTKALQEYSESLPEDTILLISAGKLDSSQTKSKWVKSLEQAGVLLQIWPIEIGRLPQWIQQRLSLRGLSAPADAIKILADRIEGNMLAADQEIEKLLLLYGEGTLSTEQIQSAVSDSARYDIFSFADASLSGDPERVAKLVFGLKAEGVEAVLMLWALQREIRTLYRIQEDMSQGSNLNSAMAAQRVWDKRKPLISRAIQRGSLAKSRKWLQQCQQLDRIIKGQRAGKAWDELLELALQVAGQPLLAPA